MELDELEAGLYELGQAIRNARYAQEYGQKEVLEECRLQVDVILNLLSEARCHISIFEEKCYKQEDGTWWKRKYKLCDYCTGNSVYYAELTVSFAVDGTGGHITVKRGDVSLDLRRVYNPDDTNAQIGDELNKKTKTLHEPQLSENENEKFLKLLMDAGIQLNRPDEGDAS
jgi:Ser-tRNA(Ala) deacylase AlaX